MRTCYEKYCNEKLYVRPNVVMIVLCPTKFNFCLTKIGSWSDVCPVKKKYLFAALKIDFFLF